MQIVIAEHRERALAEFAHEAQHVERFRSAINQVAYKPQTGARMPAELTAVPVGRAVTVYLTRAKEGIGFVLARELRLVRLCHAAANSARCFAGHWRHELGFARRRHFQLDVDAIGKRPRHATTITGDAFGSAAAAAGTVAAMPARAGVHRRNELKTRRELRLSRGARDRDAAGFERLPQRLPNIAGAVGPLLPAPDTAGRPR